MAHQFSPGDKVRIRIDGNTVRAGKVDAIEDDGSLRIWVPRFDDFYWYAADDEALSFAEGVE